MVGENRVAAAVNLLAQVESRLARLAIGEWQETAVAEIARALRDLATARLQLELPLLSDKRHAARIQEPAVLRLKHADGRTIEVALHDISAGGALIEADEPIAENEQCELQVLGEGRSVKAVARQTVGCVAHLAFEDMPPADVIALTKHIERHFTRY